MERIFLDLKNRSKMDTENNSLNGPLDQLMEEFVEGRVLTRPEEIFKAAKEGQGQLLAVHHDYDFPVGEQQAVLNSDMNKESGEGDMVSVLSWEVMRHGGQVVYSDHEGIKTLGGIALQIRY